jgi:hypothetical protein
MFLKKRFELPLVMRLETRRRTRDWRTRNPERDREIKRRYYANRKRKLWVQERKQKQRETTERE